MVVKVHDLAKQIITVKTRWANLPQTLSAQAISIFALANERSTMRVDLQSVLRHLSYFNSKIIVVISLTDYINFPK